jgi:hypothetical protein
MHVDAGTIHGVTSQHESVVALCCRMVCHTCETVSCAAVCCASVLPQTLMWLVTGLECYARNAADIFMAWGAVNQTMAGLNAPLVSRRQVSHTSGSQHTQQAVLHAHQSLQRHSPLSEMARASLDNAYHSKRMCACNFMTMWPINHK